MALPRRVPVSQRTLFPLLPYLVSEVSPVHVFGAGTRENPIQEMDPDTGFPVWKCDVLDPDPNASGKQRTVTVKLIAEHQPVPPKAPDGAPFTPVEFEGLEVTPWIDKNGKNPRLAWSIRATGFKNAPKAA